MGNIDEPVSAGNTGNQARREMGVDEQDLFIEISDKE
jgi:hypothetical protein